MKRAAEAPIEVEVAGLAFGGRGIARREGLAIFIDGVVPGDRALIRIVRRRRNYAEARLLEIRSASPDRVEPPCPYSGRCGGCTWQFIAYERQIAVKREHVQESLARIGGLSEVPVHPTLPAPEPFGYRNKMEFTCSDRPWLLPADFAQGGVREGFALGLHVPGTFSKVIDIAACLLQPEPGNRILAAVREAMKRSGRPPYNLKSHEGFWRFAVLRHAVDSGRWMVNLVTAVHAPEVLAPAAARLAAACPEIATVVNNATARKAGVAVGESEAVISGEGFLRERIAGYRFDISANSFFQTNTRGAERLYSVVARFARLTGRETLLDLFCGTGAIAITLAGGCREAVGVELSAAAVADARRNCRLNGVANCRFLQGDLAERLPEIGVKPEVVVVDPPRAGLPARAVRQILDLAPERIVYVSCNPTTLARDLALLAAAYEVREVQPVDLFPQTFHIESVARLERRPASLLNNHLN